MLKRNKGPEGPRDISSHFCLSLESQCVFYQVFFVFIVYYPLEHDLLGHDRTCAVPGSYPVHSGSPVLEEFVNLHDISSWLIRAKAVKFLNIISDLRILQLFHGSHRYDQATADVSSQGHNPPEGVTDVQFGNVTHKLVR